MNKEGHLGIVKNANKPIKKIDKIELNGALIKSDSKHSALVKVDHMIPNASVTPMAASNR